MKIADTSLLFLRITFWHEICHAACDVRTVTSRILNAGEVTVTSRILNAGEVTT